LLSSTLDAQPPALKGAFQFPPATAMHEGGNPRFGKLDLLIRSAFKLDITAHLM